MNFVKYAYGELKRLKYFESNINIILYNAPRKHKRYIEEFLCCIDNPKTFVKSYLKLKDLVSKDRELAYSVVESFKDIAFKNLCCGRDIIDINIASIIGILLTSMFIDEKGVFRYGKMTVSNTVTKMLAVLMDPYKDNNKTLQYITNIIDITDKQLDKTKMISDVYCYLFPYILNLMEPAALRDELTTVSYIKAIKKLTASRELEMNKSRTQRQSIYGKELCIASIVLFNNISVRSNDDVDAFISKAGLTSYNRTGFLKPEYSVASVSCYNHKLFRMGATDTVVNFHVREIIHKDGIIIKFLIYTNDYVITAVDDYLRGEQLLHIMFYDNSLQNTSQSMQETALLYYAVARDKYASMVNEEKYTMPAVDIEEFEINEDSFKDNLDGRDKYTRKLIRIAPYTRLLPAGQVQGPGKKEEAAKFNMVLADDETFVNSFDKHCRILKDSPSIDENIVNFGAEY